MSYKYTRGQKYVSRNAREKDKLTDQYLNRSFEYDADTDSAYQDYAKMMAESGQKAMTDTVGMATAQTGGYANSYASTAGQQVYNDYMREASLAKEDFRDRAYQRYAQEGADIAEQIAMLDSREADDRAAWEADYAADIADATTSGDTAALAQIYGYESEKDYIDALRQDAIDALPAPTSEQLSEAANMYLEKGYFEQGDAEDIASYFEETYGVNPDQIMRHLDEMRSKYEYVKNREFTYVSGNGKDAIYKDQFGNEFFKDELKNWVVGQSGEDEWDKLWEKLKGKRKSSKKEEE